MRAHLDIYDHRGGFRYLYLWIQNRGDRRTKCRSPGTNSDRRFGEQNFPKSEAILLISCMRSTKACLLGTVSLFVCRCDSFLLEASWPDANTSRHSHCRIGRRWRSFNLHVVLSRHHINHVQQRNFVWRYNQCNVHLLRNLGRRYGKNHCAIEFMDVWCFLLTFSVSIVTHRSVQLIGVFGVHLIKSNWLLIYFTLSHHKLAVL